METDQTKIWEPPLPMEDPTEMVPFIRGRSRYVTDGLLLFLALFVIFELSINVVWATDHSTSLTQLDYALLSNHSVALGQASSVPPWSVDDFSYHGQNYSALAPGTSFLALPFMAVGFSIAGGYTAYGPALVFSETFVSIAAALSAFLVYKIGTLYFRRSTSIFLGFAFGLSTICWPFATYFFQSDVSALFVLAAAYLALRAGRKDGSGTSLWLLGGVAIGIAFTVDYVNAVVIPILVAFAIVRKSSSKTGRLRDGLEVVLGALPGAVIIGAYNYAMFGNPFMSTEQAYLGRSLLGEFSTPVLSGLALNLVSPSRGLFFFAPITVIGVLGCYDALRAKRNRTEVLLLLAIFLGILVPYSMWYDPTGGSSFGPRFLVAAIPFLLIPSGFIVERTGRKTTWMVYAVYATGAIINGMAAFTGATPPSTPYNVSPFFTYTLPNFGNGLLYSAWTSYLGHSLAVAATLVILLGVVFPVIWMERARRGPDRSGSGPV